MKMDFNSFFSRFFHGNSDLSKNPYFKFDERIEERDQLFNDFESFDSHADVFKHMEDMFNKMFSSPFNMLGPLKFNEDFHGSQPSPRSIMMKDSDQQNSEENKELGFDLSPYRERNSEKNSFKMLHSFPYSKFSSIRTVHLPDGTVEELQTVINSDGKKTTTMCRSIGDMSHEVITKTDKHGLKEKEENFMNLDESELSNFEEKWNKLKNSDPMEHSAPTVSLPSTSPSFYNFFRNIFGSSQKDEVKWC